jgi:hypothetical protein
MEWGWLVDDRHICLREKRRNRKSEALGMKNDIMGGVFGLGSQKNDYLQTLDPLRQRHANSSYASCGCCMGRRNYLNTNGKAK